MNCVAFTMIVGLFFINILIYIIHTGKFIPDQLYISKYLSYCLCLPRIFSNFIFIMKICTNRIFETIFISIIDINYSLIIMF